MQTVSVNSEQYVSDLYHINILHERQLFLKMGGEEGLLNMRLSDLFW